MRLEQININARVNQSSLFSNLIKFPLERKMWHDLKKKKVSAFFGSQNISNTFFQCIGTAFGNDLVTENCVMCVI